MVPLPEKELRVPPLTDTSPDAKFVHPELVDEPESQIDIDKFDPPEPGEEGWWEEESDS